MLFSPCRWTHLPPPVLPFLQNARNDWKSANLFSGLKVNSNSQFVGTFQQFSRFFCGHVGEREIKATKISTKELQKFKMALHSYFKISVDLWTFNVPCVHTKSKQRSSSWFSVEVMAEGYQAYMDSWNAVLSKENTSPEGSWQLGRFFIDVKTWQRSIHSKVWSISASYLRENKNRKNFF